MRTEKNMLTEAQISRVWRNMIEAEVRSLYFADLASRYTQRKQIITGMSFLLSSGAAATLAARTSFWVPLVMSSISAVMTAYSIAVGLDRKAAMMAKLHSDWNQLYTDYDRLWNHVSDDDAESQLDELIKKGRDASEKGTTEAPYNERLIEKWQDRVYAQYEVRAAA